MNESVLPSAAHVTSQPYDIKRDTRAKMKRQQPQILWLTGLSGSGKSTLANLLDRHLTASGNHSYVLDGDNVRQGLNRDLGFSEPDRMENIRRVAEVARLMADAGLIVIVCFISPFANDRRIARETAAEIKFTEIFVNASLSLCETRDSKGLYAKARAGMIKNFTGIDSPFEQPRHPEITVDTEILSPEEASEYVLSRIFHV